MSLLSDSKFILGVTGAAISAAAVGFVVGRKSAGCSSAELPKRTPEEFIMKTFYERGQENPIMKYVVENSLKEPETLRKLREDTMAYGKHLYFMAAPEESQLLRLLVKLIGAKKCIEVGVYTGYNTLNMALALPPDGKVVACDITDEYVNAVGRKYFEEAGVESKIDLRIQPALKSLDDMIGAGDGSNYDFVFIDANKDDYDAYYERSLQLVRKGGLIAIDNVLWDGAVCNAETGDEITKTIHRLNQKIHADSRVEACLVPFADGVTLAIKL